MHFPVDFPSKRRKASQTLDYVPLLRPPRLYPCKIQTLQSNDSPAVLSTTGFSPTKTSTISTVLDPVIEAEHADSLPRTGSQELPSLVQEINSNVKLVNMRGRPGSVPYAYPLEINNTALSLLKSLLEAARNIHSPLRKSCSALASEMNWKADFKPILGSFEKWIIDQGQNMYQFHQDSSGMRYISYHPAETLPCVQNSITLLRPDESIPDSVMDVTHNKSIQDSRLLQNRNTKKRKFADTSANSHAAEAKLISLSTEDANNDTSFPRADALVALHQDARSEAKQVGAAQYKKRLSPKGVKRGPYARREVPFLVEINKTAFLLLQRLFGSARDVCKLASLLAAEMKWKTDFKPALGSFEKWLIDQRHCMFQFHKVAAGKSYVSYHPMEIFPYVTDTTNTTRRNGVSHEAEQGYLQSPIPKKQKRQCSTTEPTADANTESTLVTRNVMVDEPLLQSHCRMSTGTGIAADVRLPMHDQVIISQESSFPIIAFVQEHLSKIETYPVHTLLANISKSNAATTDGQGNISNNGNSSDEDRTVDCNQSSSVDRNHTSSLDEMKSENDENSIDNRMDSSHSSKLKASIVEPAISEASKVQICSPTDAEKQFDLDNFIWTNIDDDDDGGDGGGDDDGEVNYFETSPSESPTLDSLLPDSTTIAHCASSPSRDRADETNNTNVEESIASIAQDNAVEKDIDLSHASDDYTENGEFAPYFHSEDSLDENNSHGTVSGIVKSAEVTSTTQPMPHTNRDSNSDTAFHPAETNTIGVNSPQRAAVVSLRLGSSMAETYPDDSEYVFNNDDDDGGDGDDEGEVDYFGRESPILSSNHKAEKSIGPTVNCAQDGNSLRRVRTSDYRATDETAENNDIDQSCASDDYTGNGDFVPYFKDEDSQDEADLHGYDNQSVSGTVASAEVANMSHSNRYSTTKYVEGDDDDFMWTGDDDYQPADTTTVGKNIPQRAASASLRLGSSVAENQPDDTEYVFDDDFQEETATTALPTSRTVLTKDEIAKKNWRSAVDAAKKFNYPYLKGRGTTILMDGCAQIQKRHGNYSANKSKILTSIPKQSTSMGVPSQPLSKFSHGQSKSILVTVTKQAEIQQKAVYNEGGVSIDNSEAVVPCGLDNATSRTIQTSDAAIPQVASTALSTSVSNAEDLVNSRPIEGDRSLHNEDILESHVKVNNYRRDVIVCGTSVAGTIPSLPGVGVQIFVNADNETLPSDMINTTNPTDAPAQLDNVRSDDDCPYPGDSQNCSHSRPPPQEVHTEQNGIAVGSIMEAADSENLESSCTACGNTDHVRQDCRFLEFEHSNINNNLTTSFQDSLMGKMYFQITGMTSLSWLMVQADKHEHSGGKAQKGGDKAKSTASNSSSLSVAHSESINSSLPTSRGRALASNKVPETKVTETAQNGTIPLNNGPCTACGWRKHSYETCFFVKDDHPNVNLDRDKLFKDSSMGKYYSSKTGKMQLLKTDQLPLCTGCGRDNHVFKFCNYTLDPLPHPNVNWDPRMIFEDSPIGKAYIERSGEKCLVKSVKYNDFDSKTSSKETTRLRDIDIHCEASGSRDTVNSKSIAVASSSADNDPPTTLQTARKQNPDSLTSPRNGATRRGDQGNTAHKDSEISYLVDSGEEKKIDILRNHCPCTACGKFNHTYESCTFFVDEHPNFNRDRALDFKKSSMGRYYIATTGLESLRRPVKLLLCTACGKEKHVWDDCPHICSPVHPNVNWDRTMIFKDSPMGKAYIARSRKEYLTEDERYSELGSEIRKRNEKLSLRNNVGIKEASHSEPEVRKRSSAVETNTTVNVTEGDPPALQSVGKQQRQDSESLKSRDLPSRGNARLAQEEVRDSSSSRGLRPAFLCTACGKAGHSNDACQFCHEEHPNINLDDTVPFCRSSMGRFYIHKTGESTLTWTKKLFVCTACGRDNHLRAVCKFVLRRPAHPNVNWNRKILFKDSVMGMAYIAKSQEPSLVTSYQYEDLRIDIERREKHSKKGDSRKRLLDSEESNLGAAAEEGVDSLSKPRKKMGRHDSTSSTNSAISADVAMANEDCANDLLESLKTITGVPVVSNGITVAPPADGKQLESTESNETSHSSTTMMEDVTDGIHLNNASSEGDTAASMTVAEPESLPAANAVHLSFSDLQSVQVTQDTMRSLLRNKKIFDSVASFGLLRVFRGTEELTCRPAAVCYDKAISKGKGAHSEVKISLRSCYSTPLEGIQEDGEVKEEATISVSLNEISNESFSEDSHARWVREASLSDQATYCPSAIRKIVQLLCKHSPTIHPPAQES